MAQATRYENMAGLERNMNSVSELVLKKDADMVSLITGIEGAGKSTLGIHLGQFIHNATPALDNFGVENIVFTHDQFTEKIKIAPKYSCILVDEAVNFAFNREGLAKQSVKTMKTLFQCRSKNICLLMVIPDIASIDKIVREWRAHTWFYVPERGKVMAHINEKGPYSRTEKRYWDLVFVDTYQKIGGRLWREYLSAKKRAFDELDAHDDIGGDLITSERRKFTYILKKYGITQIERAKILGCSERIVQYDDKYNEVIAG